jgi:MFS family permease
LEEPVKKSLIPQNVLVLTLSRVIWSMSDTNIDTYISIYMQAIGATVPVIGLINALGSFGSMLLYPVGGYIADKSGRVKLVVYSTIIYTSSFLVFLWAPSWEWAAFAMVYQSMSLFYVPAMNAIMADSIPVGERGRLFGFNFALPNLVRIVSPYVGGLFIARFELIPAMRIGFMVNFAVGIIVTALRFFYLKETLTDIREIKWNVLRLFTQAYKNTDESLRWVWNNIRSYAGVSMLLSFLGSMILPYWIFYAIDELGLQPYHWGVILLWSGVARAVLGIFIGEIVDHYGARNCMIFGLGLGILSMFGFTQAEGFWIALPTYSMITLSSVFIWISSQVYLADSIPREIRGRIMAGLGSGMSLGVSGVGFASGFLIFLPKTIGSLIGGYIYAFNHSLPWILQTILLSVGLVYTYLQIHNPENPYE